MDKRDIAYLKISNNNEIKVMNKEISIKKQYLIRY